MKALPDQSALRKAVSAGDRTAHVGLPVEVNPYPAGDSAEAWARGWRTASEARSDHDHHQPPLKPTTPSALAALREPLDFPPISLVDVTAAHLEATNTVLSNAGPLEVPAFLHPVGELVLLRATGGGGMTSPMLQLVTDVAGSSGDDAAVLLCTPGTSAVEVVRRLQIQGVDPTRVGHADRILIQDAPEIASGLMLRSCERVLQDRRLALVVIDDAPLMRLRSWAASSAAAVHDNLRALKELSQELQVGVLATAALRRPNVMSGTPALPPEALAARGYAGSADRTILLRREGQAATLQAVRPAYGEVVILDFDLRHRRFQLTRLARLIQGMPGIRWRM